MSIINSQPLIGASGQQGYTIAKSLRFRSSASAYLNRTPSTNGSGTTFTWSGWIKRGILGGSNYMVMYSAGSGDAALGALYFGTDDKLNFQHYNGATNWQLITTAVYRDPSAWYHIVAVVDTTQATASNRIKLYVNGSQITTLDTATYPSPNYASPFFNQTSYVQFTGRWGTWNASHIYDGYLAEVNFIDGQALTPSSFGETSTSTGVWIPKKYTGTYGTNGFYLDFKDTSSVAALGYDAAGSNDWTVNNVSLTSGSTYDSMTDVPTLTSPTAANYAALNPITASGGTYSDGNLKFVGSSSWAVARSTIALPTTGKYYFEGTVIANGQNNTLGSSYSYIGIASESTSPTSGGGYNGANFVVLNDTGWLNNNATTSNAVGAALAANDVIGVAIDTSANTFTFYRNNSSVATGTIGMTSGTSFVFVNGSYSSSYGNFNINFGQRPFAYTPPTGFVALNTYNLPTPTIGATASSQANKYFDVTTYTGTGSTLAITNSGSMQPDFVWTKARSNVVDHILVDAVRGGNKIVFSDLTNAEQTSSFIDSFNSNGWTVNSAAGTGGNQNGYTYVAWQWRASNTTAVSNTAGTITSTVSANTTAGFSIVTYTGTGTAGTVGHGLGVTPSMIIIKQRNTTRFWFVNHTSITATQNLYLNGTDAVQSDNIFTSRASTTFGISSGAGCNENGGTYVAYCFAEVAGYSKFGSYTGNGSTDGTFVYTGFRPKFVMFKNSTTSGNSWIIFDTSRTPSNQEFLELKPESSAAESPAGSYAYFDFLSNGFKARTTSTAVNASGGTIIYMAFAESPFKFSNAR